MDQIYMSAALKEAQKAYKKGEIPVGAVIVYKNKIIAKAHNLKEKKRSAIAHAEILVIQKACRKLKNWHLDECTLYVTLEPCLMCCGAIIQSRIKKIVYATASEKFGYVKSIEEIFSNPKTIHKPKIVCGIMAYEARELLISFFKNKRK